MGITTISRSPRPLSPHLTCLCPWRTLYILTCRRPPPCHLLCLLGRGSDPPQPRALPLWQLFRATSCPVPAHCQTQAPPCLQTPRPRAQAQSPPCHPHSEEPARHLSPSSSPMEIKVPGTAPSPPLGPFPSLESSSLCKESPPAPPKPPLCLSGACIFTLDDSRTSVEKMFLMSGREDRMGTLPSKEGLGEGVSTRS